MNRRKTKRKRTHLDKRVAASFTIEASVVLPLCLLILASAVLLSFYMHDRVTMKAAGTDLAILNAEGCKAEKNAFVPQNDITLSASLIAAKEGSASVTAQKDSVTASCSSTFTVSLAAVRVLLENVQQTLAEEITITHLDAREEILKYKAAVDGTEKISEKKAD